MGLPFRSSFSRRELLKSAVFYGTPLAVAGLNGNAIKAAEAKDPSHHPIIRTTNGRVRGLTDNGINVFRGISYGASTGGKHRFMPPRKPAPWAGVRDALKYGPMAMQAAPLAGRYAQVLHGLSPIPPFEMSEDCLVLNVWSSELGMGAKRPVMVWLHPGGFGGWAGNSLWTDGAHLARSRDVVMVSLNHRLNIFGFLYLGDIGGQACAESGNVGMLDIVAALDWVRENIAAFGGDPDNVTLFGESGGASKVSTLMAMPSAKGLFHKAIVQSNSWNRAALRE